MQVHESVKTYSKHLPLRSVCIYGGVDMKAQVAELRQGREIVVATQLFRIQLGHNFW